MKDYSHTTPNLSMMQIRSLIMRIYLMRQIYPLTKRLDNYFPYFIIQNMEQNNNEKITLEDLAGMVKRGFDESAKNLANFKNDVDKKLEGIKKEVADTNHKVTQIDKRLFSLEEDIYVTEKKHFEKLEGRVSFVERKLGIEAAR